MQLITHASLLTTIIAFVVLCGWHAGNMSLVQLLPQLAPMQYNTALALLVSAIAMVALTYNINALRNICASLLVVFGVATLLEYIYGYDFGIDELWIDANIDTKVTHPGRMAPSTALCLILTGGSLLAALNYRRIFLSCMIALALLIAVSLLAYVVGGDGVYGVASFTRMALHTMVGFALITACLFLYYASLDNKEADFWTMAPFVVPAICTVFTLFTSYTVDEFSTAQNQQYFDALATEKTHLLEKRFLLYENIARRSASFVQHSPNLDRKAWSKHISLLNFRHYQLPVKEVGLANVVTREGYHRYKQLKDAHGIQSILPDAIMSDHMLIVDYVTQIDGGSLHRGQSLAVTPDIKAAMVIANNNNDIAMIEHGAKNLMLLAPVDSSSAASEQYDPSSASASRWVLLPFSISALVDMITDKSRMNFSIYEQNLAGEHRLIHTFGNTQKANHTGAELHANTALTLAGKNWYIAWSANDRFIPRVSNHLSVITLIVGMVCTILLAMLFHVMSKLYGQSSIERIDALAALADSEHYYAATVRTVQDGIITIDKTGVIHTVNPAFERLTGYAENEIIGKNIEQLISPHVSRRNGLTMSAYLTTMTNKRVDNTRTVEVECIRKDGTTLFVEIGIGMVAYKDHQLFVGSMRDISERKREERRDKNEMRLLEMAEEAASLGHWFYDLRTGIITWSDQIYHIHGVSKDEYTPEIDSALLFYHPDDRANVQASVEEAVTLKQKFSFEARIVQPNSDVVDVYSVGHHEVDDDGEIVGIFGVFQDITEQKNAQRQQDALVDKLAESNVELERFAYVASHDLQEPVRMIRNFSTMVMEKNGHELNEKGLKYLSIVNESAQRMQVLISDLLSYARLGRDESDVEQVDLGIIMQLVTTNLSERINDTNAIITHDNMPICTASPVRLTQLLQNLVNNGLKYQPEGQQPIIDVSCSEDSQHWTFCIKDNGIGINPDYCKKIFEPFKRLHGKTEYSGTGIGLTICQKIIENMGGTIWTESMPDHGSSFYFTLPKIMCGNRHDD